MLLMAAGYAQIQAGTSKPEWKSSYGDDPNDQKNIKYGMDLRIGIGKSDSIITRGHQYQWNLFPGN